MANLSIPLGFKYIFEPEDHELITYLSCKANGEPLPSEGAIKEIDLYSMNDPGMLFQRSQEKIIYVFTKVKKVAENGNIVDCKVTGNRMWEGVDKGLPIYDKEGCLVGEKRKFNFMNDMKMKLGYNMTEFVLDERSLSAAKFKDYVLCQIKRGSSSAQEEDTCSSGSSSAQEEDICSSRSSSAQEEDTYSSMNSIEEEPNAAIEEEFNSSGSVPFSESAAYSQHCKKARRNP